MDKDFQKLKFSQRIPYASYVENQTVDIGGVTDTVENLPKLPDMIEVTIDGRRYALWAYEIKE